MKKKPVSGIIVKATSSDAVAFSKGGELNHVTRKCLT